MNLNIAAIRRAGHSDQAVLDLLQLDQIGVVPGRIRVTQLCELWSCHQSTASRRMSAVNQLGIVAVRSNWGAYTIDDEPPPQVKPMRRPTPAAVAARRWKAAQQRWRGVA